MNKYWPESHTVQGGALLWRWMCYCYWIRWTARLVTLNIIVYLLCGDVFCYGLRAKCKFCRKKPLLWGDGSWEKLLSKWNFCSNNFFFEFYYLHLGWYLELTKHSSIGTTEADQLKYFIAAYFQNDCRLEIAVGGLYRFLTIIFPALTASV